MLNDVQFRAVESKLAKYEATLERELKRWEAMPTQRAEALRKARQSGREKLLLLYSWGLLDLMETFRKQVRGEPQYSPAAVHGIASDFLCPAVLIAVAHYIPT